MAIESATFALYSSDYGIQPCLMTEYPIYKCLKQVSGECVHLDCISSCSRNVTRELIRGGGHAGGQDNSTADHTATTYVPRDWCASLYGMYEIAELDPSK